MGQCQGKSISVLDNDNPLTSIPATPTPHYDLTSNGASTGGAGAHPSAWPSPYPAGAISPLPAGVSPSPARTPLRFLQKLARPFPPPSPAKHIKAALRRRKGTATVPAEREAATAPQAVAEEEEDEGRVRALDKSFGFGKNFPGKYELGKEVGRGHFGNTCWAKVKKGELKGQSVAVKIIPKAKASCF